MAALSFLWGQSSCRAGFSSQLIQRGTGNCGGLEVFVGREGVLRNFSLSPISYPLDTFLAQTQLRITASPREKQGGENLRVRNSRLRGGFFFCPRCFHYAQWQLCRKAAQEHCQLLKSALEVRAVPPPASHLVSLQAGFASG